MKENITNYHEDVYFTIVHANQSRLDKEEIVAEEYSKHYFVTNNRKNNKYFEVLWEDRSNIPCILVG